MKFCTACFIQAYCSKANTLLVTDKELANPEFIRDGRKACFEEYKSPEEWIEHVHDLYRDYRGKIFDGEGHEISLNMDVFEVPYIREWFRDFTCTPCPPEVAPRVRRAAYARARTLLTIMRACLPQKAYYWGVRPANDNNKTVQKRRNL